MKEIIHDLNHDLTFYCTHKGQFLEYLGYISAAASGWTGWALAHPEFGSSVNPITTKGADYAHHITASPPRFENPAAYLKLLPLPYLKRYFPLVLQILSKFV